MKIKTMTTLAIAAFAVMTAGVAQARPQHHPKKVCKIVRDHGHSKKVCRWVR